MPLNEGEKVLLEFANLQDRYVGIITLVQDQDSVTVFCQVPPKVHERLIRYPVVRILHAEEGRLMGGRAELLADTPLGGSVFRIRYPKEFVDADKRREIRANCCFPAVVHIAGCELRGHVVDMSSSAVRVRMNTKYNDNVLVAGSKAMLIFHSINPDKPYEVPVRLLRTFISDNDQFVILDYKDASYDFRRRIAAYVDSVCNTKGLGSL